LHTSFQFFFQINAVHIERRGPSINPAFWSLFRTSRQTMRLEIKYTLLSLMRPPAIRPRWIVNKTVTLIFARRISSNSPSAKSRFAALPLHYVVSRCTCKKPSVPSTGLSFYWQFPQPLSKEPACCAPTNENKGHINAARIACPPGCYFIKHLYLGREKTVSSEGFHGHRKINGRASFFFFFPPYGRAFGAAYGRGADW